MIFKHKVFNILLADYNTSDIRLMQAAIEDAQLNSLIHLEVAQSGEQALELLKNSPSACSFHLMLMDIRFPRISGKELLAGIKRILGKRKLPVIVLTISDNPMDVNECLATGADRYVQKPSGYYQLVRFCRAIRKSLETKGDISLTLIDKEYPFMLQMAV
jgi:CheY-like chemotaxis protein